MKRHIFAVITGFAVWSILWLASQSIVQAMMPQVFASDGSISHTGVLLTFWLLSVLFSVIAGFLTAQVAQQNVMKPAWVLGGIQLLIGIMVQSMAWDLVPVWYHLLFLVMLLPGILLGAKFWQSRQVQARAI